MLKGLNNIKLFLIFLSIFILSKECYSSNGGVFDAYFSKYTKEKCNSEIQLICPTATDKSTQKECYQQRYSFFSDECKLFFDVKNKKELSITEQQALKKILSVVCQDETINFCKGKIKKGELEVKSISNCFYNLVKKEKKLNNNCILSLQKFVKDVLAQRKPELQIKNLSSNIAGTIQSIDEEKKLYEEKLKIAKQREQEYDKNIEEEEEKKPEEMTDEELDALIDDGEEYIYFPDDTRAKKKYVWRFRKRNEERIRNMTREEAEQFERGYLVFNNFLQKQ